MDTNESCLEYTHNWVWLKWAVTEKATYEFLPNSYQFAAFLYISIKYKSRIIALVNNFNKQDKHLFVYYCALFGCSCLRAKHRPQKKKQTELVLKSTWKHNSLCQVQNCEPYVIQCSCTVPSTLSLVLVPTLDITTCYILDRHFSQLKILGLKLQNGFNVLVL